MDTRGEDFDKKLEKEKARRGTKEGEEGALIGEVAECCYYSTSICFPA